MPRVRKPASERLSDSLNVPVPRALKRRVIDLARRAEGQPSHTKFARILIEEGVERREQAAPRELETVGAAE